MIVEELNNFSEPVLQLKNNLEQSEEPEIIVIDLAERDKKINLLNDILTQKKMQIMQQYNSCKMCNHENRSCYKNNNYNMDEIINNYEEYFRDQITNKEKQINNLNLLKMNLDELLNSDLLFLSPLLAALYNSCILAIKPGVFKSSNKVSEISKIFASLVSS